MEVNVRSSTEYSTSPTMHFQCVLWLRFVTSSSSNSPYPRPALDRNEEVHWLDSVSVTAPVALKDIPRLILVTIHSNRCKLVHGQLCW